MAHTYNTRTPISTMPKCIHRPIAYTTPPPPPAETCLKQGAIGRYPELKPYGTTPHKQAKRRKPSLTEYTVYHTIQHNSPASWWQNMYTEHDINIILSPLLERKSPAKVHFSKSGKCPSRQVRQCSLRQSGKCSLRQMFTSASPANGHFGNPANVHSGKSGNVHFRKCSLRQVFTSASLHFGKSSLWQVRQMSTSAIRQSSLRQVRQCSLRQVLTSVCLHFGKCSLRQVFTSASSTNVHIGKRPLSASLAKVHIGKSSLRQVFTSAIRQTFTSAIVYFGNSRKQSEHIMQALHEDDGRGPGISWVLGG